MILYDTEILQPLEQRAQTSLLDLPSRDKGRKKSERFFTMKSLILAQDER